MTRQRELIAAFALMLSGCINKDEKIVDLSAGVFIFFIALTGFKHFFPVVADTRLFRRFSEILQRSVRLFIYPLYIASGALVIAGFALSGIHEVLIFVGFTLGVLTVYLSRYSAHEASEDKKRALEIVFLALGVVAVLALLWGLGADLFDDL